MPVLNRMKVKRSSKLEVGELICLTAENGDYQFCVVEERIGDSLNLIVIKSNSTTPTPYVSERNQSFLALSYGDEWLFEAITITESGGHRVVPGVLKGVGVVISGDRVFMRVGGDPNQGGSGIESFDLETKSIVRGNMSAERMSVMHWRIWAHPDDRKDPRGEPVILFP